VEPAICAGGPRAAVLVAAGGDLVSGGRPRGRAGRCARLMAVVVSGDGFREGGGEAGARLGAARSFVGRVATVRRVAWILSCSTRPLVLRPRGCLLITSLLTPCLHPFPFHALSHHVP
jgi:hypothetical protein